MNGRTLDPETGYIGRMCLGTDLGVSVRCERCGGRGMTKVPLYSNEGRALCLRCHDDWDVAGTALLRKHGYKDARNGHKKWWAAFNEFLATQATDVDIEEHNRRIIEDDFLVHTAFPEVFGIGKG